jgi:hypothetical protein
MGERAEDGETQQAEAVTIGLRNQQAFHPADSKGQKCIGAQLAHIKRLWAGV